MDLLIATGNPGKVREYDHLLAGLPVQCVGPAELELNVEVDESGETYQENAQLKALAFANASNRLTLADDSGLEVDALGGRPGVRSARYGGPGLGDADRWRRLLQELDGVPWEKRTARFRCVIALATPEGLTLTAEGACEGIIALEAAGDNGFGYDPVFYLPNCGRTMAQLVDGEKNQISHRGPRRHGCPAAHPAAPDRSPWDRRGMTMTFRPDLLPMTIGSLPHRDVHAAWELILARVPDIPAWPQLPRRAFFENMYVQYSERFPGVVLDLEEERIWVDREQDLDPALEGLYTAYLEEDLGYGEFGPEYATGLATLPADRVARARAIKGQVTGPVSWGLVVTDQNRRPTLYEEVLADAITRHLRLKASWQEQQLRQVHPETIIFIDEPYMASFGSAYVAIARDQVITLMEEVLAGVQGLKGVHCCGNTDWSILLDTSVDILSLDAYEYAHNLALYPKDVRAFIARRRNHRLGHRAQQSGGSERDGGQPGGTAA